jgi:NDP-sugar pyrophosphorylase family protein
MSYLVCIPTAGIGSRLGSLTKSLNKSLIAVANKPVLAHIIEHFPDDAEFVIALGYKGKLVQEFIEIAFPALRFQYMWIDPFDGPGSGLGYTLLCCRTLLKEPFVFCSCDTLTSTPIPVPDHNWMAYASVEDLAAYRTLCVRNGCVLDVCEKGSTSPDLEAYIGIAGIRDAAAFWSAMEEGRDEAIMAGEAYGMRALVGTGIRAYAFSWHDTGNVASLASTREALRTKDSPIFWRSQTRPFGLWMAG